MSTTRRSSLPTSHPIPSSSSVASGTQHAARACDDAPATGRRGRTSDESSASDRTVCAPQTPRPIRTSAPSSSLSPPDSLYCSPSPERVLPLGPERGRSDGRSADPNADVDAPYKDGDGEQEEVEGGAFSGSEYVDSDDEEQRKAPYGLPAVGERGKRKEEAGWVEVVSLLRPHLDTADTEEELGACAALFAIRYRNLYSTRCMDPDASFVRSLLTSWQELPATFFKANKLKTTANSLSLRGLLGRAAKQDFTSIVHSLTNQLERLPTRLTKANLDRLEIFEPLQESTRLLDGAGSLSSVATSLSSSSDTDSHTSRTPAPPPRSKSFTYEPLPTAGSTQDLLFKVESCSMLNNLNASIGLERAHGLPRRPTKHRLFYALKLYYILVSGVVPPEFRNNNISNLFYLDSFQHGRFDKHGLLIIPSLDFLEALQAHLESLAGPFIYKVFIDSLPSHLHPSKLAYQVLALKPQETPFITVYDSNKFVYDCEPDGVYRCSQPSHALPPRTFSRQPTEEVPDPHFNPVLLIIDAVHKLLKDPPSTWPEGHDNLFLLLIDLFAAIFRRIEHDAQLFDAAVATAGHLVARDKMKRKHGVDEA
ncbi:hypothetical protein JCM6882_008070 [Rhodosporidiobolus microsporus]